MNIDACHSHVLWFESETGDVALWDPATMDQPPVETHPYAYARFPMTVSTQVYRRRPEDGGYGEKDRMVTMNSSASEELVLALATGRNALQAMRLSRAMVVASQACERCMNALAYAYGLVWGYPEGGEEWRRCGTECEMCRHMGFSGQNRERSPFNHAATQEQPKGSSDDSGAVPAVARDVE